MPRGPSLFLKVRAGAAMPGAAVPDHLHRHGVPLVLGPLRTGAGARLWIVDWDEAVVAPRERDLFFVVGGIGHGLVGPGDTDSFLQGYGGTAADPRLLAYYRCAWAVQDIAAYGEQTLLAPGLGEASRRGAVEGFEDLFAPGNIADLALA